MFHISVPYCSLDNIYKSKQPYGWIRVDDGDYIIPHRDKIVRVKQKRDNLLFSCNEEDFYNIWYKYFDMNTDYASLHFLYRNMDEDIKPLCNRASGVHILQQDLLLVIIASILESSMNYNLVDGMIYDLRLRCGKKRKNSLNGMAVTWYEFPTVEQIITKVNRGIDIYCYKYIKDLLSDIQEGWLDLDLLSSMNYESAENYLLDFDYIDYNAKNKILLNYFGYMNSIIEDDDVINFIDTNFEVDINDFLVYYTNGEKRYFDSLGYLSYVIKYNWYNPIKNKKR